MLALVTFSAILFALLICVYVFAACFIFWMAVDAARQDKFWWLVLVIAVPLVGSIVYYFTEKKHDYMKMPKGEK